MIAAIIVILVGSFVAQAAGIDVFGAIAHWTAETFNFEIENSSEENGNNQPPVAASANVDYPNLTDALLAYGIKGQVIPTWWPEEFELAELKVSSQKEITTIHSLYQNGTRSFAITIRLYASSESAAASTYEKDIKDVVQYEKGGITHYIMSNIDDTRVSWINNLLVCSIAGDITEQEAKEMIDSIYEG